MKQDQRRSSTLYMPSKRIQDYFEPYTRKKQPPASRSLSRTLGSSVAHIKHAGVPGLSVISDFVTPDEESSLLAFLDAQPWRTDLSRRTMHYGGSYCLMPPRDATPFQRRAIEQQVISAPKIPSELNVLLERMIDEGLYSADTRPEYCIVNEYLPGQGISAHVENFRFGEPVCSLTLAGDDYMRFHELRSADDGSVRSGKASVAPRTGRSVDARLCRRSLAVLTRDARYKWQHEIVRGRKAKPIGWRRVSLTFRTEKRGNPIAS